MKKIVMPRLGLTMEEGTLIKWHKKEGELFKDGEVIFELATDKIIKDMEATFNGKLIKIVVNKGETVPVTTVIAEAEEII